MNDIKNPFTGKDTRIVVVGLGYVGLPLAMAFDRMGYGVVGFDVDARKVADLKNGLDRSGEVGTSDLLTSKVDFTNAPEALDCGNFYIVTVPTPADRSGINMTYVERASQTVGHYLKWGDVVVYESTVYPGTTDTVCASILEKESGMVANVDFTYGYSPERINPGDPVRNVTNIVKITSGSNQPAADYIDAVYNEVVTVGTHKAASIEVAESAKIMENVQRDVNIALVNEMSSFFRARGVDSNAVIDAAATKWNFAEYRPGLVGGHCIGTDTYYYLDAARRAGISPRVTSSARSYHEDMPEAILSDILNKSGVYHGSILIMGYTFKENCKDFRNTRVQDLYYGIVSRWEKQELSVKIWDPLLSADDWGDLNSQGLFVLDEKDLDNDYDIIIAAVAHDQFKKLDNDFFVKHSANGVPFLADIKGMYPFANWKL